MSTLSSAPSASCAAVSVTVCAASQFARVNVSADADGVATPVSPKAIPTVVVAVGCAVSLTV